MAQDRDMELIKEALGKYLTRKEELTSLLDSEAMKIEDQLSFQAMKIQDQLPFHTMKIQAQLSFDAMKIHDQL
ncbi:unnamed protein product [Toxocara canis]|uniref:ING domain-containing protein n=1 Tax=Toxocara canis TaxID=6265 RepID=A0A183U8R2_TOXCA|nr:unnamed protein product [Toxocara canis]